MSRRYTFVEKLESEFYSIKLLEGPYRDVIYTYGHVTVQEDVENDLARLKFKYRIEEVPPPLSKEEIEADSQFNDYIGDILAEILEDQAAKIGNAGHTDTDTEIVN